MESVYNFTLSFCLRRSLLYIPIDCACGDLRVATTKNYIEILNFRHFFNHFVFTNEGDKIRNKQLKKYINVSVVIDMECGNTRK